MSDLVIEKLDIQLEIFKKVSRKFDDVLEGLLYVYGSHPKYYPYSDLKPYVLEMASEFDRNENKPFSFFPEDAFTNSLATESTEPLVYCKDHFLEKAKKIIDGNYPELVQVDLLSQLLNGFFEAIDDVRIFARAYAKKANVADCEVLFLGIEERGDRHFDRFCISIKGQKQ